MQQASQPSNETRLPRAVVRRVAAATAPRTPNPADPEPTAPAAPSDDPNAPAAAVPDANAPKAPNPPEDPRHSDPTYWKHRFEAVAGRLRAREDEHKAALSAFRQENDQLRAEILRLQQAAPASTPAATINLAEFFTPEQIKNLGEEDATAMAQAAVNAAMKVARETVTAEIKPLLNRQQEDSEAEAQRKVREFEEAIEEAVPNYRVLDKDEGWLAWLDEEDAATGLVRQDILTQHCARLNAPKVIKMFQAYIEHAAKAAPVVPEPPVAPSGSGASGGDTPPQPLRGAGTGYPTQAEIKDFYKRSATKKPGDPGFVTDKERADFEARLKLPRR